MKINKTILLAALGLCAASANASWLIQGNAGDISTKVGTSGTYTFTIVGSTDLSPGDYALGPTYFESTPSPADVTDFTGTTSQPTVGLSGTYIFDPLTSMYELVGGNTSVYPASPGNFTLTVKWYVPLGAAPTPANVGYSFNVFLNATPINPSTGSPTGPAVTDEVGNIIVVVPAPEPAQALAGAMLLGCGGLIFAGRRLFTKKSV